MQRLDALWQWRRDRIAEMSIVEHRNAARTPIAIVAGCCFRYDAITAAVFDTFDALAADPRYNVTLLTSHNEVPGRAAEIVRDASELLLHPAFRAAEAIIYHFGIYHPLFDVMVVGNGKARQAAAFHNITPPEFLPPSAADTIARSYRQLNNLRFADRLWPVSRTNVETLAELDFDATRIDLLPLAVSEPAIAPLSAKRVDRIDILFLGRIVQSKGVIDLIEAMAMIPAAAMPPFHLNIAGNLAHSDSDCVAAVKALIEHHGLSERVTFLGTIDDNKRNELLRTSHILAIPSYHEGFCKPVIEGLRAGCIPLGYAAYNLRHIAEGLGRMVPVGDRGRLSSTLTQLIRDIHAARSNEQHRMALDRGPLSLPEFDAAASVHVAQFEPERIAELTRMRVRSLLELERAPVSPFPMARALATDGDCKSSSQPERDGVLSSSRWFDWAGRFEKRRQHAYNKIEWHVPKDVRGRFLDIGCGTGNGVVAALQHGFHSVVGLDRNLGEFGEAPSFNDVCKAYGVDSARAHLIEGDISDIDLGVDAFDCVMMLDSIEHVANPEQFIEYAARALAPGGVLLIDTSPLYYSRAGHHLFDYFDQDAIPWAHLRSDFSDLLRQRSVDSWSIGNLDSLNRVTHDELMVWIKSADLEIVLEHRSKMTAANAADLHRHRPMLDLSSIKEQWLFEDWVMVTARKR